MDACIYGEDVRVLIKLKERCNLRFGHYSRFPNAHWLLLGSVSRLSLLWEMILVSPNSQ
jgi:hypothetical protein